MNKSAAVYPLWKGFERFKWPLRAPLEGRHQEVKWADGLLHIDGAVTKGWFNGFGTLTLCCIREPTGEQLCLGGWGASPAAVTLPSPPLPGLSPGQQSETPTWRLLQSGAIKTD